MTKKRKSARSSLKPVRRPSVGSLRWFRDTWEALFADRSRAGEVNLAHAVAQLSYENKKLRERLGALEELVGDIAAKTGEDFEKIFSLQENAEKMTRGGFEVLGVKVSMVDLRDPSSSKFEPCGNPNCVGCKEIERLRSQVTKNGKSEKDGMVTVAGNPHLQECDLVKFPDADYLECTCGSEGERERQERLRHTN